MLVAAGLSEKSRSLTSQLELSFPDDSDLSPLRFQGAEKGSKGLSR